MPRDEPRGVALLTTACEGEVALACLAALRWLADRAHAADVPGGTELRGRLDAEYDCLQGTAESCFVVGLSFSSGRAPFPRDLALSAAAYQRGCNLGHGSGCSNLGDAYEYGNGAPRDLPQAATLYARACRVGTSLGCANLGHLTENGEGVRRDATRARALYREACTGGEVYGCLHLEMMESAPEAGRDRAQAGAALTRWQARVRPT